MQIIVTGRHIEVTEAMRQRAQEKAGKLPRYYDSIARIEVIFEGGSLPSVEVIASGEHNKVFIGREEGHDVYACIDLAVHKLERQLTKKKGVERDNKHGD